MAEISVAESSNGRSRSSFRPLYRSRTAGSVPGPFDSEKLPQTLAEIRPFLRVANQIEKQSPRAAYLCKRSEFSVFDLKFGCISSCFFLSRFRCCLFSFVSHINLNFTNVKLSFLIVKIFVFFFMRDSVSLMVTTTTTLFLSLSLSSPY